MNNFRGNKCSNSKSTILEIDNLLWIPVETGEKSYQNLGKDLLAEKILLTDQRQFD